MTLNADIKTALLGIRLKLNEQMIPLDGRVLIIRKGLESEFKPFLAEIAEIQDSSLRLAVTEGRVLFKGNSSALRIFGFTILFRHQIMDYLPLVEIGEFLLPPICLNCSKPTKGIFCASCGANIPTFNMNMN